ncbi:hypothetical protein NDU88_001208 [Pleurodeles waltl]|uniref:Uncharacterized protein n=1 Tax=Pleurodeles waltl TaxID=8319 RepID=A0AAV7U790_PLEWA|nr:hypothetical protein NDU88_001208 [Pleurodeles waltl]
MRGLALVVRCLFKEHNARSDRTWAITPREKASLQERSRSSAEVLVMNVTVLEGVSHEAVAHRVGTGSPLGVSLLQLETRGVR